MKLRILFSWALLLLCAINLSAQKRKTDPIADSLVAAQFDKGAKLQWSRSYQIMLDDVVPAQLHLGFDGTYCNGFLAYTQSEKKHTIKGTLIEADLFLVELDNELRPVSTIEGKFDTKKIIATRILTGRKSAQKVEGIEISKAKTANASDPVAITKWYRKYNTKWDGKDAQIYIARMQAGMITGRVTISESQPKTYHLKGKVLSNGVLTANLLDAEQRYCGTFKGNTESVNKVSFTIDQPKKSKLYLHSTLEETLAAQCLSETDEQTQIDAVFPTTKSEALNQLMTSKMQAWMRQVQTGVTGNKTSNARLTATAWTNITCWEKDLLCLVMTMHSSNDTTWSASMIIYNTKKDREIPLAELFQERFDYENWFKTQAQKHQTSMESYTKDPAYAKWLDQSGFPVISLRAEGFAASSLFHPVYGVAEVLLPWDMVKPYLRSGGVLKDLIKG
jgi:hypothetical protein